MVTSQIIKGHAVFTPLDLGQVRAVFPAVKTSVIKGRTYAAVPHTLESARILKNLGIDTPSPIRTEYAWPIRPDWKPRWWQEETAEFFSLHPRAHCHDAMRLGKTMATLWAMDYLKKKKVVNKTLVVAPLSSLELAWGDNLYMNFHHLTFAVLHGSAEKRRKLLAQNHDVYIINHDGVEILLPELMARKDINLVVIDELHEYFNIRTKKWKALNQVVNCRGIATLAWGLTGTPMSEGRPTDAFGQAKLIRPEVYKGHFTKFKTETMYQCGPFKWYARKGSEMVVQRVLAPSIRHERNVVTDMEPCLIERHAELSEQQKKHLNELLKQATTEIRGTQVTAVNAAVLIQKIVQTSCISLDTPVLTSRGWTPIQKITKDDAVWDGIEWVTHDGVVFKGVKNVIACGGVTLTPDHLMLTANGWKTAQEIKYGNACEGLDWTEVRTPHGFRESSQPATRRKNETGLVGMSLRLWCRSNTKKPKSEIKVSTKRQTLWLSTPRTESYTRYGSYTTIQNMDTHETALLCPWVQGLPTLWRKGYNCMRQMAGVIREFLGRYVRGLQEELVFGQNRKRRKLRARELSVGNYYPTGQQQENECVHRYTKGAYDRSRSGKGVQHKENYTSCEDLPVSLAGRFSTDDTNSLREQCQVFDIINCGPRNRFVVKGDDGSLRIVHNCGCVYGSQGEFLRIDYGPRLKVLEEVIAENNEKVLVFVPFKGALHSIATELKKRWSVDIIDGDVSVNNRNQIFKNFQTQKDPHIIVAHPATMSYSLDLTAASLIVWYAPYPANKIYDQACARIDGGKQKAKIDICHISATPTERKIYAALREKGRMQNIVLDLLKSS